MEIARQAGWDDSVKDIETRIKTAVLALENAGYVQRGKNVPHIYATSILAKNMEEAKLFVDFILSKEAQEIMSAIDFTTPTNPLANPPKEAIKITDTDLIDYDSNLAAKQKEEVLETIKKVKEANI